MTVESYDPLNMHVPLTPSSPWPRRIAMTATTLGSVVSAFEGTVVTSAMPTIAHDLRGSASYGWVFSTFLITSTLTMLVCGKLADSLGRRPVFVGGMGLFLLGSILCGTSTSFAGLIVFRAIQGLGAGALQPMSMTIGADLYKLEERARVQVFTTAAWGLANVVGPLMGGWIVTYTSWRWVFWVNVPVGALAVALLLASYRDPPRERRGPLGAWGALLAGAATALASFAVAPDGLPSVAARLAVATAALAAVALLVHHQARGRTPLLARTALAQPEVRAGLVASACLGGILYSTSAYVPLWIISHGRGSSVVAGAALVPLLAGWALGSGTSVRWLVAYGMRAVVAGGFAIATVGALALSVTVASAMPASSILGALAVLGLGLGPVAMGSVLAPQSRVAWADRAAVTSAMFACRMLGGSIAVAAIGAAAAIGHAGTEFVGIAVLAAVGLLTSLSAATNGVRIDAGDAALVPGE